MVFGCSEVRNAPASPIDESENKTIYRYEENTRRGRLRRPLQNRNRGYRRRQRRRWWGKRNRLKDKLIREKPLRAGVVFTNVRRNYKKLIILCDIFAA